MDEEVKKFEWLPAYMPGVAKLFNEQRAKLGREHVNECWRRGVLQKEPGWFFAREGALAIGVPWETPLMANFAAWNVTRTQALLVLRDLEAPRGSH